MNMNINLNMNMKDLNDMDKHLRETLELLGQVVHGDYMGLARTWWHSYSWHLVHARHSCSIVNLIVKMTGHGANMGEIDGGN